MSDDSKPQCIKYESSDSEEDIEEVSLDEKEDEGNEERDLEYHAVIPPSQAENKWTRACLIKSIDGRDRRQGWLYWNFRSEDNTWKGGTYLLWDTMWGVLQVAVNLRLDTG